MAGRSQALVHNWRLKLSAVGLSVFLWALVQTEPTNQETFASVPVLLEIADTSWEWNFDDGRPGGTRGIGGELSGGVIDTGGRIIIPSDFEEFTDLGTEIVFIGRGHRFLIMSTAVHAEYRKRRRDQMKARAKQRAGDGT